MIRIFQPENLNRRTWNITNTSSTTSPTNMMGRFQGTMKQLSFSVHSLSNNRRTVKECRKILRRSKLVVIIDKFWLSLHPPWPTYSIMRADRLSKMFHSDSRDNIKKKKKKKPEISPRWGRRVLFHYSPPFRDICTTICSCLCIFGILPFYIFHSKIPQNRCLRAFL